MRCLTSLLAVLAFILPLRAQDDALTTGRQAYQAGDFAIAAEAFAKALQHGDAPAGGLLHALGDCAFRLDDPARALWLYRRALLRQPSQDALRHDLRVAATRLGVEPPPRAASSRRTRVLARLAATPAALLLSAALALQLLGLRRLLRQPAQHRRRAALLLGLGLLCGLLAWRRATLDNRHYAQVLAPAVVLRADPHDAASTVYRARAGETLRILERSPHWARVEHPVAGTGWVAWRGLGPLD